MQVVVMMIKTTKMCDAQELARACGPAARGAEADRVRLTTGSTLNARLGDDL